MPHLTIGSKQCPESLTSCGRLHTMPYNALYWPIMSAHWYPPHTCILVSGLFDWFVDAGATCAVRTVSETCLYGASCIGPGAWKVRFSDKALAI